MSYIFMCKRYNLDLLLKLVYNAPCLPDLRGNCSNDRGITLHFNRRKPSLQKSAVSRKLHHFFYVKPSAMFSYNFYNLSF